MYLQGHGPRCSTGSLLHRMPGTSLRIKRGNPGGSLLGQHWDQSRLTPSRRDVGPGPKKRRSQSIGQSRWPVAESTVGGHSYECVGFMDFGNRSRGTLHRWTGGNRYCSSDAVSRQKGRTVATGPVTTSPAMPTDFHGLMDTSTLYPLAEVITNRTRPIWHLAFEQPGTSVVILTGMAEARRNVPQTDLQVYDRRSVRRGMPMRFSADI